MFNTGGGPFDHNLRGVSGEGDRWGGSSVGVLGPSARQYARYPVVSLGARPGETSCCNGYYSYRRPEGPTDSGTWCWKKLRDHAGERPLLGRSQTPEAFREHHWQT
eukprot:756487-Hanusia_phi.AAC.4